MLEVLQKRKFRILLACISLLFLANMVQETYAKYVSTANANSNFSIARWAFLVNQQDVLSNSNFSNTIIPTWDANQNIQSGVIAPTITGYFDIIINSSNVGVSFDEVISLARGSNNTVTDIVFVGYTINNGNLISLNDTATANISTTHSLGEQNTINTYRVYIKWNDNAQTETMNNASDTLASSNGTASISVTLNFTQRAS